jgi:hypothetical protein
MAKGEYVEAGAHIGNFCENLVNILREAMGDEAQSHVKVGHFVDNCLDGNLADDEPDSIRLTLTRVLSAAYDIRNSRDSVHMNLQIPVNHADTQAGIAMCSWMLAEVLRVYGDGDEADDMDEIGGLIEEITQPVEDGNPLSKLETGDIAFDRAKMADALDGLVQIDDEGVHPDTQLTELDSDEQVLALMLGRQAAVDLGNIDSSEVGETATWFAEYVTVGSSAVGNITGRQDSIRNDSDVGGYYIPEFRVEEALTVLTEDTG